MRAHSTLALLLLGLLAAAIGVGCHRAAVPGAWRLALATTPTVPVSLTETQFVLHVTRPDGQPADGLTASLALVMRSMDMGPNRIALNPRGHGDYVGTGQFPMAGAWECRATVASAGPRAQTQLQSFPLSVQ